jgi:hypothetical protein
MCWADPTRPLQRKKATSANFGGPALRSEGQALFSGRRYRYVSVNCNRVVNSCRTRRGGRTGDVLESAHCAAALVSRLVAAHIPPCRQRESASACSVHPAWHRRSTRCKCKLSLPWGILVVADGKRAMDAGEHMDVVPGWIVPTRVSYSSALMFCPLPSTPFPAPGFTCPVCCECAAHF